MDAYHCNPSDWSGQPGSASPGCPPSHSSQSCTHTGSDLLCTPLAMKCYWHLELHILLQVVSLLAQFWIQVHPVEDTHSLSKMVMAACKLELLGPAVRMKQCLACICDTGLSCAPQKACCTTTSTAHQNGVPISLSTTGHQQQCCNAL